MERLKILLVEDEPGTRLVLERMLSTAGHEVHTAENGDQAVTMVDRDVFDVVLTDVSMPGETDGVGVLEWVKNRHSQTQVLLMTAYANVDTAVDAMKKGAVDYLQKPVESHTLSERLESICSLKSTEGERYDGRVLELERLMAHLDERCDRLETILSDERLGVGERVAVSLEHIAAIKSALK